MDSIWLSAALSQEPVRAVMVLGADGMGADAAGMAGPLCYRGGAPILVVSR